jgi:hypothetical protein
MTPSFAAVITTIAEPTTQVERLVDALRRENGRLYVAGDRKGPVRYPVPGAVFLSLEEQEKSTFALARLLPTGHYARKNIGYLQAVREGYRCLYETDDDNAPASTWRRRPLTVRARVGEGGPWVNVYRYFSDEVIWPRGFPLNRINDPGSPEERGGAPPEEVETVCPIQQGLVDGSPDVDAVWRLVFRRKFSFREGQSVWLPPGSWCPFNSQNTWWWTDAIPLMYLPSHCSFRMTDIWRSFIAQRCLWEAGRGVVFHPADMVQERNVHDLMTDFVEEFPGYRGNEEMARILADARLAPGTGAVFDNLMKCYSLLSGKGFFPGEELALVAAWRRDLESLLP